MEYLVACLIGAGVVAASAVWGWLAGASVSATAAPGADGPAVVSLPIARPIPAARAAQDRLAALVSGHRQWAEAAQGPDQNGIRSPRQS
jgi:hypothetical protein